jgi:hypothetical protein
MTEDDVRQLLRELGEEAPPADSLVRVRQRVAERTAAGRRRRVWWWPVLAAAVAAVCLLVVVLSRPQPQPRMPAPPPVVAVVEPPPAPAPPPPFRVARKPPKRDGLVIRMETNDPDVVILLIADDSE